MNPENKTKPSEVCLLDWQLSKKGSPAYDLSYFFFAHSPKEILYDYKNYLKLYHDTVSTNLREFSCDPEEVFPYSLLEYHWNTYLKFGLYISLIMINVMCCDEKEAPDFEENTKSERDLIESLTSGIKTNNECKQRMKDLINFFIDNEFI
ncbi:hypothetical protein JTB14_027904 [Gonioctena quinquepunctata]|nr:hypothetical protein JTB14_027904 [Gonioctena quinquepunctata]